MINTETIQTEKRNQNEDKFHKQKRFIGQDLNFLWFVNPDCKMFGLTFDYLTEKVISLDAFLTVGFIPFFV